MKWQKKLAILLFCNLLFSIACVLVAAMGLVEFSVFEMIWAPVILVECVLYFLGIFMFGIRELWRASE